MLRLLLPGLLLLSPRQDDCPRGLPEPVLKKAVFPTARFQLNKARREGFETAQLGGGTRLSVRNWGCETYTLTLRFEGQLGKVPADARAWYRQAAALLRQTAPGLDAAVHPAQAAAALTRAAARAAPALNQELDYGGTDIREYVVLEKARRVGSHGYDLAVTLSIGPL
ncbi:hypothetical protein LJ737_26375 [Hymenobacter sp. 15J16-1T3B]|uniref:hypothetical protein n=1 Tax=Hymenobacter sp. 15J16-1T3B TaxID=2886941 RepID=UPI001D0F70D1|nr:hypothetical protein [Hymenobacter sp. 15J16-1T3B]MCC3160791.1 hypothetical protein [Hymenobacter sp. 15J16-1T3B]